MVGLKATPKLPRLRMRDELLQVWRGACLGHCCWGHLVQLVLLHSDAVNKALCLVQSAPELARLLGEDLDSEQTAVFEHHSKAGTSNRGPGLSVQGAKGGGSHATSPDNPGLAAEEELTEEDELVQLRPCFT